MSEIITSVSTAGDKISINDTEYVCDNIIDISNDCMNHMRYEFNIVSEEVDVIIQEEIKELQDIPEEELEEVVEGEEQITQREVTIQERITEKAQKLISIEFISTDEIVGSQRLKEANRLKTECGIDILERYPAHDQANMTARIGEINTVCLLEDRTPSDEELADIATGKEMIDWIRERREKCALDISQLAA